VFGKALSVRGGKLTVVSAKQTMKVQKERTGERQQKGGETEISTMSAPRLEQFHSGPERKGVCTSRMAAGTGKY